jgi:hypothetical protein
MHPLVPVIRACIEEKPDTDQNTTIKTCYGCLRYNIALPINRIRRWAAMARSSGPGLCTTDGLSGKKASG